MLVDQEMLRNPGEEFQNSGRNLGCREVSCVHFSVSEPFSPTSDESCGDLLKSPVKHTAEGQLLKVRIGS